MNQEAVVEVSGVKKRFGDRWAVSSISFSIARGECLALLGPNGAGKTTTIHMLLGLVVPDGGSIRVFGLEASGHLKEIKQGTGVCPQNDNLDPDLTVVENLVTYASYFGIGKREALARAGELLEFFALSNRSDEVIQNLSGGQRRRLLIARALINRPGLFILDEPTIGLDPQARHLIWERLEALKAGGTTMLLTSHYMEEVSVLADRVIILDSGRVVVEGRVDELVREMVGNQVVEVSGPKARLQEIAESVEGCDVETESNGTRLYVYLKGPCDRLDALGDHGLVVVRRPANLEDLFLRLTGRRLREE